MKDVDPVQVREFPCDFEGRPEVADKTPWQIAMAIASRSAKPVSVQYAGPFVRTFSAALLFNEL